jgi:hypothetical protein
MTNRPAVRIRALVDFTLGDVLVRQGAAIIVSQTEARRLIAAGLCRIDAANGNLVRAPGRWVEPVQR